MKKISLILCLSISILLVNAQGYKEANEEIDQYFSEKNFNWEIVEKSFQGFLIRNKIKLKKGEEHIAYYNFVEGYKEDRKIKKSDKVFEEFSKLKMYTDREFVYKFGDIFNNKDFYYKKEPLKKLFVSLLEGPTSYNKMAYLFSKAFTQEEFKHSSVQKLMVCLIYSEILPSEFTRNEEILYTELNNKLDDILKKNNLNYIELENTFEEISTQFGIKIPGDINEGYFLLEDSLQGSDDNIKTISEVSEKCLDKLNSLQVYQEINSSIKKIKSDQNLKIKVWSPINSTESMFDAIFNAGDVSPYLILGGIKISFSNSDLNIPAYKKLYLILTLSCYKDIIENKQ